jgi:hypothetical protein
MHALKCGEGEAGQGNKREVRQKMENEARGAGHPAADGR